MRRTFALAAIMLFAALSLIGAGQPDSKAGSSRMPVLQFSGEQMQVEVLKYRRLRLEGDPDRPIIVGAARFTTTADGEPLFEDGRGRMVFRATYDPATGEVSGHAAFKYSGEIGDGTDIFMSEGRGTMRFRGYTGDIADGTDIFMAEGTGRYSGEIQDGTDI